MVKARQAENGLKSSVLSVTSVRTECVCMIATMFASWIRLPETLEERTISLSADTTSAGSGSCGLYRNEINDIGNRLIRHALSRVLEDRTQLTLQRPVVHPGAVPELSQHSFVDVTHVY